MQKTISVNGVHVWRVILPNKAEWIIQVQVPVTPLRQILYLQFLSPTAFLLQRHRLGFHSTTHRPGLPEAHSKTKRGEQGQVQLPFLGRRTEMVKLSL